MENVFLLMYIDKNERINDSTIYRESPLYAALQNCSLNIPLNRKLTGQSNSTPFFFIGDDEFPLSKNLMKPYNPKPHLTAARPHNKFSIIGSVEQE